MRKPIIMLLAALLSATASAQTFPFAGALDDGDRVADGLFTFELALLGPDASVLWTEEQANVVVVDGVFALDVGASTPLPATIPGRARLAITVDGDALPPVPLARLLSVTRAAVAATAETSASTNRLADRAPDEVATREALANGGGPPLAFANITGLASTVADGDQGTDVTSTSTDFAISGPALSIATVNGSRLAPGSVTAANISAVGTASVADGAVTGEKVLDGTMTRSRFDAGMGAREIKTTRIFVRPAGCDQGGDLTEASSCLRRSCTPSGGGNGRVRCDGTVCESTTGGIQVPQCFMFVPLGELVLE